MRVWYGGYFGLGLKAVRRDFEEMDDVPPYSSSYPELCLVHPPPQLLIPIREIT